MEVEVPFKVVITVNQARKILTEINRCEGKATVEYEEDGKTKAIEVECGLQVLCDDCMERLYNLVDWADGIESPNEETEQKLATGPSA